MLGIIRADHMMTLTCKRWLSALPVVVLLVGAETASAQTPLRSAVADVEVRIFIADMAVLSSSEPRQDLFCVVTPLEPRLGFDLQFHAGYRVTIPLKELAGNGNSLRVLFRVLPLDGRGERHYFVDRFSVPPLEEDAKGEALLPGRYTLGPGRYRVEWLMRDRAEKVCSAHWEIATSVPDEVETVAATRAPNSVAPRQDDVFLEEPPVQRAAVQSLLHVKLLVNFTPTDPGDARLRPYDLQNIVSILRAISREPQMGTFSLTAFNMQEERVIFEQNNVPQLDFPALGEAVESIQGGVVDAAQLQDKESGSRFLTQLLQQQLSPQDPQLDAVIIIGPKLVLEKKISGRILAEGGKVSCPIFYLIYNADPRVHPWRDAISAVLKAYKALEYSITLPKDLGRAMTDMMFRLGARRKTAHPAM